MTGIQVERISQTRDLTTFKKLSNLHTSTYDTRTSAKIRKRFSLLFSLLYCFFLCLNLHAQSPAVARLDSNFAETGNPFLMHLTVPQIAGKPTQIDFSPWDSLIPQKNIIQQSDWKIDGDHWTKDLTLLVFDEDTLHLPGLPIRFDAGGTAMTSPLELIVLPTPSPDDPTELSDIKDIHREPVLWTDYWPWFLGVGIVLLVLALFFWLAKRRRHKAAASRLIQLPPHELALKKLGVLMQKQLWQNGLTKQYYAELTFILREYLQQRFLVPALESSSSETIRHLKKQPDFPAALLSQVQELLEQADLAKFAKATPSRTFHEQSIQSVKTLVEQTIPVPKTEEVKTSDER